MFNFNYIIVDKSSRQTAIIDPAWNEGHIIRTFDELGVKPDLILLTHSHIDHVNLVPQLVERFHSRVYMSAQEIDFYHFHSHNLFPLYDLEEIQLGETRMTCLLTPGHTVGSLCFLLSDSLFTGDTIFTEGCGICTQTGGSPEQMFESIQRIKKLVPPHVHVYPGHTYGKAPGQSIDYLLLNNIYFQFNKKEQFVQFRMRKNQPKLFFT
ncbi:putative polyketide biosynthesis zinc-dependent hydrolase PksB [Dictyobacter arantiisoli]|uniref:Putative polyketide biosynthesis zinc-dependent hydrolase PksB n=2 Tax=Dictyobacter arantiisoli TaxID=2014874 RepID=A0A5A5T6N6_9CHLR|nr:MBL fold metallo-hydrolase [Dictyobacter arantiisoli]GCF07141.1 putative polyketide biosynthesis zinc-dependent hydrolase PksB [Dictyobacter arantiisoli]